MIETGTGINTVAQGRRRGNTSMHFLINPQLLKTIIFSPWFPLCLFSLYGSGISIELLL